MRKHFLPHDSLPQFLDILAGCGELHGPTLSDDGVALFGSIERPAELRLDYRRTLLPPKPLTAARCGMSSPTAASPAGPVRSAAPPGTASTCWSSGRWARERLSGCGNGTTACSRPTARLQEASTSARAAANGFITATGTSISAAGPAGGAAARHPAGIPLLPRLHGMPQPRKPLPPHRAQ